MLVDYFPFDASTLILLKASYRGQGVLECQWPLRSGFSCLCALMPSVNLGADIELYCAPLCVSG